MSREVGLLTLDYTLGEHELYITIDRNFSIKEVHFRSQAPVSPQQFLQFTLHTFATNRQRIEAFILNTLKDDPEGSS